MVVLLIRTVGFDEAVARSVVDVEFVLKGEVVDSENMLLQQGLLVLHFMVFTVIMGILKYSDKLFKDSHFYLGELDQYVFYFLAYILENM